MTGWLCKIKGCQKGFACFDTLIFNLPSKPPEREAGSSSGLVRFDRSCFTIESVAHFLEDFLLRFASANSQHCTTSSLTDTFSDWAIFDSCSFKSLEIRNVLFTYSVFLILNSNINHLNLLY